MYFNLSDSGLVLLNDWSPLCIVEIAANAEALALFNIYWGSGSRINTSLL
jgi:hypothetical protein